MNAHVAQRGDGGRAVFLDNVGHGDHARQLAAPGEEQRRFAFFRKGFGFIAESLRHVGFGGNEGETAAQQLFVVQRCGQAVAGQSAEIADLRNGQLCLPRRAA